MLLIRSSSSPENYPKKIKLERSLYISLSHASLKVSSKKIPSNFIRPTIVLGLDTRNPSVYQEMKAK